MAPALSAQFNDIEGLDHDSQGNLFLSDYANHTIRKLSALAVVCVPTVTVTLTPSPTPTPTITPTRPAHPTVTPSQTLTPAALLHRHRHAHGHSLRRSLRRPHRNFSLSRSRRGNQRERFSVIYVKRGRLKLKFITPRRKRSKPLPSPETVASTELPWISEVWPMAFITTWFKPRDRRELIGPRLPNLPWFDRKFHETRVSGNHPPLPFGSVRKTFRPDLSGGRHRFSDFVRGVGREGGGNGRKLHRRFG